MINKISKNFKSKLNSNLVDTFFNNAIKHLLQRHSNTKNLDEILVLVFEM